VQEWENAAILNVVSECFGGQIADKLTHQKCYFVNFLEEPELDAEGIVINDRPKLYRLAPSVADVRAKALEFQKMFNEESRVGKLELVLFEYALEHLMRISRVINMDRGSMMLVGVGGSGKQSLSKLASYIAGNFVFQITITKFYSVTNLFEDIKVTNIANPKP